jgi:hypothetical protein
MRVSLLKAFAMSALRIPCLPVGSPVLRGVVRNSPLFLITAVFAINQDVELEGPGA